MWSSIGTTNSREKAKITPFITERDVRKFVIEQTCTFWRMEKPFSTSGRRRVQSPRRASFHVRSSSCFLALLSHRLLSDAMHFLSIEVVILSGSSVIFIMDSLMEPKHAKLQVDQIICFQGKLVGEQGKWWGNSNAQNLRQHL